MLHLTKPIEWNICIRMATDISKGHSFLHQKNILHRDIKSLNVLLDELGRTELTDSGLSKVKNESCSKSVAQKILAESVGTIQWMVPEFFKRKAEYQKEADVYSLAVTLGLFLHWNILANRNHQRLSR